MRGPLAPIASLIRSRRFIYHATRQRLARRYANTWFGYGWLVLQPLIFLAAIGLIRVMVFESTWRSPSGALTTGPEFLAALFIGLVLFWFVSEPLSRMPSVLREFGGIIKNEPIEVDCLVGVVLFESIIQTALRLTILFLGMLVLGMIPSFHIVALPLLLLPMCMGTLGLGWIFARLGLYYRDLEHVLPPLLSALFFVSAVFFPLSNLPAAIQGLFLLNPIAFTIESARDTILWQAWPNWQHLGLLTLGSFLTMWLGWLLFNNKQGQYVDNL